MLAFWDPCMHRNDRHCSRKEFKGTPVQLVNGQFSLRLSNPVLCPGLQCSNAWRQIPLIILVNPS
eukprot:scaffold159174_cov13-Tisochrysis_lutea.AAC.1